MDKGEYLMLDFRINTFLTVCQTMNFTKAAEELHITQPTVSQHIHYLEDYYETSLFTYQNRQLALTEAGKILQERLLVREEGSGTRNILERNLSPKGLSISDFIHYTQVENMHTIIELLKKDCGISFLYKIAVKEELAKHTLKEIKLRDFSMKHDFDFIWTKGSIYAEEYEFICDELTLFTE